VRRAPAHAGRLRRPERFAFALVLVLMAAFVVGLAVAASGSGGRSIAGRPAAAGSRTVTAGATGAPTAQPAGRAAAQGAPDGTGSAATAPSAALDARLAVALRLVTAGARGHVSVGIIDESSGAEAVYHAGTRYHGAGIVTADILAALLYQHQAARTAMSAQDADLATRMIENGDNAAAAALWTAIGGGSGLAAANRALLLAHTRAGRAGSWAATRTTVSDQLQLLGDLTSGRSPLATAARDYELGLLSAAPAGQRWGVPAAAVSRSGFAVSDGVLSDQRLWGANSVGVIQRNGQDLLIAVLSGGSATKAAGMSLVRAAALAAAQVISGSSAS
jgi:hypothetical protein